MIKPKEYLKIDDNIEKLAQDLEDEILEVKTDNLVNNIKLNKSENSTNFKIKEITKKSLKGFNKRFKSDLKKSIQNTRDILKTSKNPLNGALFSKESKELNKTLSKNINTYLVNADKSIKKILGQAINDIKKGETLKNATLKAIKQFSDDSNGFVVSPSGRKEQLEVVIKRHYRTKLAQIDAKQTLSYMNKNNLDLVEITTHQGSRESHSHFQGKVFSLSGNKYPNFYTHTRYGYVDGLCGINCRHSFYPYNKNSKPLNQTNFELNAKQYKLRQIYKAIDNQKRKIAKTRHLLQKHNLNANQEKHQLKLLEQKKRILKEKVIKEYVGDSNVIDITDKFNNNFNQSERKITMDDDFNINKHKHEIKIVELLSKKYGGHIHLIQENKNTQGIKYNDFDWDGIKCEIKSCGTINSINNQFRKAKRQVGNDGIVVLDMQDYNLKDIENEIIYRLNRSGENQTVILIKETNEVIKIFKKK